LDNPGSIQEEGAGGSGNGFVDNGGGGGRDVGSGGAGSGLLSALIDV